MLQEPNQNGGVPYDLEDSILALPGQMETAAIEGEHFRAIRVGRLPNVDGGMEATYQSSGIVEGRVEEISAALLSAIERTSAETMMVGEIPITEATLAQIFDSPEGLMALSILIPGQDASGLKEELRALLEEKPFIFHAMISTTNMPVGYYGGTSGRNDAPNIFKKLRSAHLLAQGMDEKSTVAMRTEAGDFAEDGAFITGGKMGEIGLFSGETGDYLELSDDLKLLLMAYMASHTIPFANEAAWNDAFAHDEALERVARVIELPTIHRAAPDVLTAPNYSRWVGAFLAYRGGDFDPESIPGFDSDFLDNQGLEATGVDRMYGGFDGRIVDVSTVTAAGTLEEAVAALALKNIPLEQAKFLVLGGGKVTQGMLDWAFNQRPETLEGGVALRPDQFVVIEPYEGPIDVIQARFPGVTVVRSTSADYIEGSAEGDGVAPVGGRKFDVVVSNSLGKDLKPEHLQSLSDAGVQHLSGAANVKLNPDTAQAAEALMVELGMGTVPEYLINAGGWLCCMAETLLREYYGGSIPQDPELARKFMQYVFRTTIAMNAENLRRSQERADKDGIGLNAAAHAEINDAVSTMRVRYDGWLAALQHGDNAAKASVLHELQLGVGAREFLVRMTEELGFPVRANGQSPHTKEELETMLSDAQAA
ncbi:MAG: hypothetical protein Q8P27_00335 [Candidatus Peregrinibacteria bacterium]|nr:hypothetical protein [Candidatus Peregrinibacteria bacterium]